MFLQAFHRGGGGVCLWVRGDASGSKRGVCLWVGGGVHPLDILPPYPSRTPPPPVNIRAVRILLECFLVICVVENFILAEC